MESSHSESEFKYEMEFIHNSRGMKLFTCRWLPRNQEVKALVFLCHGYGVECSVFMRDTGMRLSKAGYAVFGIDFEGHGKSEGMRCYIPKFSMLVDDFTAFAKTIREYPEYKSKAKFLYGESMGGAVALLVHRKEPRDWNGAVLVAPMCKISEKLKPNPFVTSMLIRFSPLIRTWKIVPTSSIIETGFKDPVKREMIRNNPYYYKDKPRVNTALEMLQASLDIESRLDEVTFPFLTVHGEDDIVTDPEISRELYARSRSVDKTLKVYKDMWHGLTVAESDEYVDIVFGDILSWLDQRSSFGTPVGTLQRAETQQAATVALTNADLESIVDDKSSLRDEIQLKGVYDTPAPVF